MTSALFKIVRGLDNLQLRLPKYEGRAGVVLLVPISRFLQDSRRAVLILILVILVIILGSKGHELGWGLYERHGRDYPNAPERALGQVWGFA